MENIRGNMKAKEIAEKLINEVKVNVSDEFRSKIEMFLKEVFKKARFDYDDWSLIKRHTLTGLPALFYSGVEDEDKWDVYITIVKEKGKLFLSIDKEHFADDKQSIYKDFEIKGELDNYSKLLYDVIKLLKTF